MAGVLILRAEPGEWAYWHWFSSFIDGLSWRSVARIKLDICWNISRRLILSHLARCQRQSSRLAKFLSTLQVSECRPGYEPHRQKPLNQDSWPITVWPPRPKIGFADLLVLAGVGRIWSCELTNQFLTGTKSIWGSCLFPTITPCSSVSVPVPVLDKGLSGLKGQAFVCSRETNSFDHVLVVCKI